MTSVCRRDVACYASADAGKTLQATSLPKGPPQPATWNTSEKKKVGGVPTSSWGELLKTATGESHVVRMPEFVLNLTFGRISRNTSKILESGKGFDSLGFHAFVGAACSNVLVLLGTAVGPIDHQSIYLVAFSQAKG